MNPGRRVPETIEEHYDGPFGPRRIPLLFGSPKHLVSDYLPRRIIKTMAILQSYLFGHCM
jgi:hypothetical protein